VFKQVSELSMAQTDEGSPTAVAAGSAPGESGVFVLSARFKGGLHISATPRRDYVVAHLDEPIAVGALAKIAGRSPFHFTRVFNRSVGMTPYRYVVHLRLRRALELVRDGRHGLAEIAAITGFADQSHLSRWIRRVHGVPPTELAAL